MNRHYGLEWATVRAKLEAKPEKLWSLSEILTEEQYRELQTLGTFDTKTSSWIRTPSDIRSSVGPSSVTTDTARFSYITTAPNLTMPPGGSVDRCGSEGGWNPRNDNVPGRSMPESPSRRSPSFLGSLPASQGSSPAGPGRVTTSGTPPQRERLASVRGPDLGDFVKQAVQHI